MRRAREAGAAVLLSGQHPRRRAALRRGTGVRRPAAHRYPAGPLLRHGHHRAFHGGRLRRSCGRGNRARSGGERQGQRRGHGCAKRPVPLRRRRAGRGAACRRGSQPAGHLPGPAPQGLRRGDPGHGADHGSPPCGDGQLQRRHRRPGLPVSRRPGLPPRESAARGPVPPHKARGDGMFIVQTQHKTAH